MGIPPAVPFVEGRDHGSARTDHRRPPQAVGSRRGPGPPHSADALDGRECRDVVTQISAASKALDQAGFKLIASGLTYCLNNPEQAAEQGYDIDDVQKMFMKLA